MINASNEFKHLNLGKDKRDYLEYADITLKDGTELHLENKDFWNGGMTFEDAVSSDNSFDIGAAIINKCDLTLVNIDDRFSDYDFEGAEVVPYVGLALDEIDPWVGRNLLRGTNSTTLITSTGYWETGTWTTGGDTSESIRKSIQVSDCPDSIVKLGWHIEYNAGSSASIRQRVPIETGKRYTVSCYARGTGIFHFQIGMDPYFYSNNELSDAKQWKRYSFTFEIDTDHQKNGYTNIYFGSRTKIGSVVEICGMKLEEGDIDTTYSIAPEDIRIEKLRKGTFTVDETKYNGSIITMSCLDNMRVFDRPYSESKMGYPAALLSILLDACKICGVTLQTNYFPHNNYVVQIRPEDEAITFREIVSWVAQIAGCFARFDAYGRLELKWYDQKALENPATVDWGVGEQILRGTNSVTKITSSADWSKGEWGAFSGGNGKIESIEISDCPNKGIKKGWRISGHTTGNKDVTQRQIPYESGKTYTLSCYARCISGSPRLLVRCWNYTKSKVVSTLISLDINNTDWQHFSGSFVFPEESSGDNCSAQFGLAGAAGEIQICGMKLEEGDHATEWTNSPYEENAHWIHSNYSSPVTSLDDVVITGVRVVEKNDQTQEQQAEESQPSAQEEQKGIITYQTGTDGYVVSIENNELIKNGAGQTVASWLGEQLIGMRFRKAQANHASDPTIEAGDIAVLTDRKGSNYNLVVSSTKFSTGSAQNTQCSAENPARNSAARYSAETKNYVEWRKAVQQEKNARELAQKTLADELANSSGLYMYEDKQPDGSTIYYMHDKPTLEESMIIWKLTANAFAISTDGGKNYPYGLDASGVAILREIYTIGLDADYIKTGAITVADDDGNILFSVDMDTKKVIISGNNLFIGSQTATDAINEAKNKANEALEEVKNSNALQINLDNDYQGIPVNADGSYTTFPECKTRVSVFYGHTDVSAQCTYTTAKRDGLIGSWSDTTRTYTVTGLSTDTGWVDITATYLVGELSVTKRFNIAKIKAGAQGVPGSPGKDGTTYYTWIKYADDANGGGMSESPANKKYIGIATNKPTPNESSTASDYTWSLIKGSDGVPGAPGADGKTYYTWIKYAYDDKGTGISDDPTGREYIGFAYNKEVQAEGTDPKAYKWSLIKGENGEDGRSYFIATNASVVKVNADKTYNPNWVEATSYYISGSNPNPEDFGDGWWITEIKDAQGWKVQRKEETTSYDTFADLENLTYNQVTAIRFSLYSDKNCTHLLDQEEIPVIIDAEALTQTEIFNLLTNNGAIKGIVMSGGQMYVNADYINTGTMVAERIKGGTLTIGGLNNANGRISIRNARDAEVGYIDNEGVHFELGVIKGRTIDAKGITVKDGSNNETFSVDANGNVDIYGKISGKWTYANSYYWRAVLENGGLSYMVKKSGGTPDERYTAKIFGNDGNLMISTTDISADYDVSYQGVMLGKEFTEGMSDYSNVYIFLCTTPSQGYTYTIGGHTFMPNTARPIYILKSATFYEDIGVRGTTTLASAPTISSDANIKHDMQEIDPEQARNIILNLEPKTYKYNDGTSGRTHRGFIVQDIETMMDNLGIDSKDFAAYVIDEDGNGYIRYEEFLADIVSLLQTHDKEAKKLRETVKKQQETLDSMQEQINALQNQIQQLVNQAPAVE